MSVVVSDPLFCALQAIFISIFSSDVKHKKKKTKHLERLFGE